MAGNDWINGYLEAILDAGSSSSSSSLSASKTVHPHHPIPAPIAESGIFNPTKYFVEEVVESFDESDIHRSWLRVSKLPENNHAWLVLIVKHY
jgi:sucrose-phosphate synthase